jgi:hypothetical protein
MRDVSKHSQAVVPEVQVTKAGFVIMLPAREGEI